MIHYSVNTNFPVYKFRSSPSATTAVAAWTPTTSTRIWLTDVVFYQAAAGTAQLRFGNVGGSVIAEFMTAGSVSIGFHFDTPKKSGTYDQAIFLETGANGQAAVSLGGFEEE